MTYIETVIDVRMSLSVRPESSQLECAFSFGGEEFRAVTSLLSAQLLNGHRREMRLAIRNFHPSHSVLPEIRRELRRIIPRRAITLLRNVITQKPEISTLSLEIMLNDPTILESYPWEVLSDPGMLVDRRIAVVIWRSVPRQKVPRRPSSAVLLVGSAPLDTTSTNAPEEIAHLARIIGSHAGIHPYARPSITFKNFVDLLLALHPSVIHIVAHGSIRGFQFQRDPEFSRDHDDIPPQELATYLATSSTANLVLLNACDSANPWDDRIPMARQIATDSSTTAIGMSAEVPSVVGANFSESFFQALMSGYSTIEAFGGAVRAIRRSKKFTTLWSIPVMYAPPASNVIIFPTGPLGRVRLQCQELRRQLRQLENEAADCIEDAVYASDTVTGLGAVAIRLAYIRDLLDEIEPSALQGPDYLYSRLLLSQTRTHSKQALQELGITLRNIGGRHHSREQRMQAVRSVRRTLGGQARAFTQLEYKFSDFS
jgi:hypothetical protein